MPRPSPHPAPHRAAASPPGGLLGSQRPLGSSRDFVARLHDGPHEAHGELSVLMVFHYDLEYGYQVLMV